MLRSSESETIYLDITRYSIKVVKIYWQNQNPRSTNFTVLFK